MAVRPIFLSLCLMTVAFVTAFGQSVSATLSGTVTDQNGAVVPGVAISLVNPATSLERTAITNDSGYFNIPLLPPGAYTITAHRDGFAPLRAENVILNVGDQKALQIQLKTGDVSAMVQVTNETPLINESPAVATVVDRQFVGNLPLNGRTFQSLINLSPGVVTTKSSFIDQGQFSVNGQRGDANYFTVDGVSANFGVSSGTGLGQSGGGALPALSVTGGTNNLVSIDAMQEFKIQTSTYAPEFGRTPGAQVQILTRSGTNDFHGTLFEYFRNDALDAEDWFVNANRLPNPALRQNQFGGVVGGPLHLPRFGEGGPAFYSGRDRTFFFFSYEGLRLRLPQSVSVDVPSLAARQDPRASAAAREILNTFPIPTGPTNPLTNMAEFVGSYSDPSTLDSYSLRIDHSWKDRFIIFGRYNYAPSRNVKRGGISALATNQLDTIILNTYTFTAGLTAVISPSLSNEFRANWSKSTGADALTLDNFGGGRPPSDSLLFPPPFSRDTGLFIFIFTSGRAARFTVGNLADNFQRQVNMIDNLSIGSGSHQLKLGVDYRRLTPHSGTRNYSPLFFADVNTLLATGGVSASISAFESLGIIINNFSAYGQDTWKLSNRLTLTYGLRWELNPPPKGDNLPLYGVQGVDNPATIALAPAGTPLYKTSYTNFAPRFGFSYQLSQRQGREAVIRGGVGIFYDLGTQGSTDTVASVPYRRTTAIPGARFPLPPAVNKVPPITLNPPFTTVWASDPNLDLPRTYQWNLTLERSLGGSQTFSAAYVAALGRKLLQTEQITNPNPDFVTLFLARSRAESSYHAMQLQFTRRLSRGFQALSSYTWSKSIDMASTDAQDNNLVRGPSDFDVRHSFSGAVTYNLPTRGNTVVKALLGNWAMDGIFTARSATPFNLVARSSLNIGGFIQNVRPDLILGTPIYIDDPLAPHGRRLNREAFAIPPLGRQGTLGRNAIRGFPVYQFDLAFRRQFSFTERFNVQLRAELFNIFNHPNFGDPVSSLTSTLFGRSTQMLGRSLGSGGNIGGQNPLYQIGGPRSVQLALKLHF